ncbi:MAG: MATE family efflux transporter [Kiloniellales bacterium]
MSENVSPQGATIAPIVAAAPIAGGRSAREPVAARHPWRREIAAMVKLALPLAATQLLMIGINTSDVVMMGWLGPDKLAAGSLGFSLYMPVFLFGVGLLSAVSALAAQALGAKEYRGVRRSVRQGLWVATAYSVLASLLLWHGESILLTLGQDPATAALAGGYLRAALWGFPGAVWVIVLRGFVTALSRPRSALLIILAGTLLNIALNYVLMFGHLGFPRLELVGAGIATSIVNLGMVAIFLAAIQADRKFRRHAILARFWRPDWPRFRRLLTLGLPIGITVLAETAFFSSAAILMGWIGTAALAAHTVALQCAAVAFMVPLGVSQATTVRVGLAFGAGDRERVGRAGWTAFILGTAFMSCSALAFWFAGPQLVGLFLDRGVAENAAAIALAVAFLRIAAVFQLLDGAQVIGVGALRGLQDTLVPMAIAVLGYWAIGFPVAALLGFTLELGGEGVWWGLASGLAVVAGLLVWRFAGRDRLLTRAGFTPRRA